MVVETDELGGGGASADPIDQVAKGPILGDGEVVLEAIGCSRTGPGGSGGCG